MSRELNMHNRSGEVVGQVMVDEKDYEVVSQLSLHQSHGYPVASLNGESMLLGRFLLGVTDPHQFVDHKKQDITDHRQTELRVTSPSANSQNSIRPVNLNSGYIGVQPKIDKWTTSINIDGVKTVVGTFENVLHAAYCYDDYAIEIHGEGAKINGIPKPDDYVRPVVKRHANDANSHIVERKNSFTVRFWDGEKEKFFPNFQTRELAVKKYEELVKEKNDAENQRIMALEITRNADGIAVIPVKDGDNILYALVDDNMFHQLIRYFWRKQQKDGSENIYCIAKINGKSQKMHHFVLGITESFVLVDHRNGIGYDNRIFNLRRAPHGLNSHNRRKHKETSSKYVGVRKRGDKYAGSIGHNKVRYHCGVYETEELAAYAVNMAAIQLYKEDARLNDVPEPQGMVWDEINFKLLKEGEEIKPASSQYRGVTKYGSKYVTKVCVNGKSKYCGEYSSEIAAAFIYDCVVRQFGSSFQRQRMNQVSKPVGYMYHDFRLVPVDASISQTPEEKAAEIVSPIVKPLTLTDLMLKRKREQESSESESPSNRFKPSEDIESISEDEVYMEDD